jgi:tRNA A-37 threonylcarbamoyl transferase component Bud32/tetratricopeptide (TPR) repeat protein
VSHNSPTRDDAIAESPAIPSGLIEALSDRYLIVRETGRGASATVYLARDIKHDRLVALKTLTSGIGTRAGERFLREIQVAAGMQHPHILPMYDSGIADGRLYFVMPFVDGGSLRDRLDAEPQIPVEEALRIAHEIAIALAFAHDQGIVHRDIKPDNILFYHGHACLADFGVARIMEQIDVRLTAHGMIVGTPAYMSPEQLSDGGFDGRSDVYSLACVLYEMIGGVHAFAGSTPAELLRKRLRTTPEPLHLHRADVPPYIDDLLKRALATSPEARFSDARAFAESIEVALQDVASGRAGSISRRAVGRMPGHPLAWAGSVAMILALASLGAAPLRSIIRDRSGSTLEAATESARDSYRAGKIAFDKWDLPNAEREFARATHADPRFVSAQLLLAQTLELERRLDTDQFRIATARLRASGSGLRGRDSLYADALIALGERSYKRACDSFSRLRTADSLDALAWYGLGDCLALDSLVVRDAQSPTGWSFRTSWPAAAQAYMRAAIVDPAGHRALSYSMIASLLPTASLQIRFGRTADSPVPAFGAHPSLVGDTLAYVPVPLADLAASKGTISPTLPEALGRNRDILLDFARDWVGSGPQNPEALEALAAAREARGELGLDSEGAGGALKRARAASASPEQQLRLATIDVRLRLKRGEFEAARVLADSLLSAPGNQTPTPTDAARLSGVAALTGRLDRSGQLRTIATSEYNAGLGIAPPLTAASSRLFVRAAAGICDDSLLALRREIDRLLESYGQPGRRDAMRRDLLVRPMSYAYPCLGSPALESLPAIMPLDVAQHAAAAKDGRLVRAVLDSIDEARRFVLPGEIALDFTVQEAWLRASLGDTATAVRQLDRVLNALPTLSPWSTREDAQAAAFGRALVLRAEIAANRGEVAERQRRAREAMTLWEHADPSFSPTLDRLRALAAPTR